MVVQVGHGPHLGQAVDGAVLEESACGLAGEPLAPAVGVKLPADLDLARAVGKWLEERCPYSPAASSATRSRRVSTSEPGLVPAPATA
jgi:hypothetical protein